MTSLPPPDASHVASCPALTLVSRDNASDRAIHAMPSLDSAGESGRPRYHKLYIPHVEQPLLVLTPAAIHAAPSSDPDGFSPDPSDPAPAARRAA